MCCSFCFICTFTFAFSTVKWREQSIETYITFDCVRLYVCALNLSVLLYTSICLSSRGCKLEDTKLHSEDFMWKNAPLFCHLLYPAHVFSLILQLNTYHCVSLWCLNYTRLMSTPTWSYKWISALPHVPGLHRNASNNHWQDNRHCVIFGFTLLWQHCPLTA